jgi:hypothetical protein
VGCRSSRLGPIKQAPVKQWEHASCEPDTANCIEWDPDYIWVESGLIEKALVLTAIPAFLVGLSIVRGFARLGVSEVTTFMTTMPVCITLWFYSAGWLLDRWKYKRRARLVTSSS